MPQQSDNNNLAIKTIRLFSVNRLLPLLVMIFFCWLATAYTFNIYRLADTVLRSFLSDYEPIRQYKESEERFFVILTIFTFWLRHMGAGKIHKYYIAVICVTFPLIFFLSAFAMLSGNPSEALHYYYMTYCPETAQQALCGEAFAQFVFNSSVKAIPTLSTAPLLYWLLIFKLMPFIDKKLEARPS